MYFMGKDTVNRYDNFKAQIFGHKKDQFKQKYKNNKAASTISTGYQPSNNPFFKKVFLLSTVSIAFYFANQKFKLIHQTIKFIDSLQLSPTTKLTINTLASDIKPSYSLTKKQYSLCKHILLCIARLIFKTNLSKKNAQTNLNINEFLPKIWTIKLRLPLQSNLISQNYKSKLQIGNINLFGTKTMEILEFQHIVNTFMKYRNNQWNVQRNCSIINGVNRVFLGKEEYQKVYEECVAGGTMRYGRIKEFVDKSVDQKKKGKKSNRFIVNLS